MPRLGNKLRKAARTPTTTAKPKVFELRTGTRNEMGPPVRFSTEAALRRAATKALRDWEPWCLRHNNAGTAELKDAVMRVSTRFAELDADPRTIDCLFDEHYGAHIVLPARKVAD